MHDNDKENTTNTSNNGNGNKNKQTNLHSGEKRALASSLLLTHQVKQLRKTTLKKSLEFNVI